MNSRTKRLGGTMAAMVGMLALVGGAAVSMAHADDAAPAAAGEALPPAKDLIERSIEATGGRAAFEAKTNRRVKGTISIPVQGLSGTLTVIQAAPASSMMQMELPGLGKQVNGSDGVNAWQVSDMTGPQVATGDELKMSLRNGTFNAELQWDKLYTSATTAAVEMVDGKPAYRVDLMTPEGTPLKQYFDKESGLLVQSSMIAKTQMGDLEVVSKMEDYREVDGLKLPFKTTQNMMGVQIITAFESVEHNVELAPDTFAMPETVKKVLEAQQKPAEAAPAVDPAAEPAKPATP